MIKEHGRFQLESTKLGRSVIFQVTVFEKVDRRRTSLFAETQCSDPYQFIIQFVIKDAESMDELISRFIVQLAHRGFSPDRYRVFKEGWGEWIHVEGESSAA
jgi:hypothetical protein